MKRHSLKEQHNLNQMTFQIKVYLLYTYCWHNVGMYIVFVKEKRLMAGKLNFIWSCIDHLMMKKGNQELKFFKKGKHREPNTVHIVKNALGKISLRCKAHCKFLLKKKIHFYMLILSRSNVYLFYSHTHAR